MGTNDSFDSDLLDIHYIDSVDELRRELKSLGVRESLAKTIEVCNLSTQSEHRLLSLAAADEIATLTQLTRHSLTSTSTHIARVGADGTTEIANVQDLVDGIGCLYWNAFRKRVQIAAQKLGMPSTLAGGVVASLDELVSNIREHCEYPETGLIGFKSTSERFELVVADRGIGVLESLRKSGEFDDLQDNDAALELALTDGISRFGKLAARGYGFRQLLKNLAFSGCELRFRTGTTSLLISETNRMLSPAIFYQGFLMNLSLKSTF